MKVKFYLMLLLMICGKVLCGQTITYTDPYQLTAVTFTLDASQTNGKPSYTGVGKATDGSNYTYHLLWCSIYNPQNGKTAGAWILGSDQDANVSCSSGNPYWVNMSTTNAPPPTSGNKDGWFYPLNDQGGNTGLVLSGSGLFGLSTLNTTTATNVAAISATFGGTFVADGGQTISDKGVVYGTSANPTTANNKVSMGTGATTFSQTISALSPSTTYHYRAYAINASGTSYGTDQTVTTLTPTISANISTVTMPGTTYGTASGNGSFAVSGAGMAAGILVTPSSGFEVSLSSGSGFGSSLTVGAAGLTIASTVVYIRLKSTDAAGSYSGNVILSSTAAASKNIAEYPVTVATQAITITAAAKSKTYGDADPALTYSLTAGALQNGDSFSGALSRAAGSGAGTYAINQGTVVISNNYTITFVGANFVIGQKAIGITVAAATKTYGNADPVFTYNISSGSLVSGDSFTGTLTRDAGSNAGTYNINQGTLSPGNNYTFTFTGNTLTITQRPITLAPAVATKVYGDADPGYQYTFNNGTSLASGDGITGTFSRAAGENAGTYALGLGTTHPVNATTGADESANYNISFVSNNLTITQRPIIIAPVAATKVYGDADPGYPYRFNNGTSVASGDGMTGTFSRPAGENVGTYALALGTKHPVNATTGVDESANYSISFVSNNLTITVKTIRASAAALSKTYGSADPALTYAADALASGDSFSGSLTRATGETTGNYAISQGSLALSSNYSLIFTGSTFTINTKTINVTANAQTKSYGGTDPALTYTADALIGGDTFTGSLTRASGEAVGSYAINQGNLALSTNYTLNYTEANFTITAHTNAALANFTISNGTLSPSFDAGTFTYTASVNTGTHSETVTPALSDATATVTVNGTAVTPASPSVTIPLSVGANVITTIVTAQDGLTTKTYTTTVNRAAPNLNLTYLTANGNDFEPTFDNSITSYTSNITGYPLATIDFALEDPTGSIAVNGNAIPAGQTYANIPLTLGSNPVSVVVTAQDPTFTKTFNVAVNYTMSNVARLDALNTSLGGFDQDFDPATTTYTKTVSYGASSIAFNAYCGNYGSIIKINGITASSNLLTQAYPLTLGTNAFTVEVTAQDGITVKDYTVTITRVKSTDAYLNDLTINSQPFDVPFGYTGTNNYTASVVSSVSSVQVKAVTEDTTATVTINGTAVASGSLSGNIPVAVGQTVIPIVVTAQDGTTTLSFSITVTRAASTNASLANLTIDTGTLDPVFDTAVTTYNVSIPNGTTQVTFTPTAADPNATISVGNTPVTSGASVTEYINAIQGTNQIPVKVTAQSGATQIYYVNVTPVPSDANLSALSINTGTLSPSFDPNSTDYSVNVDHSTTAITITATTHDPLATVSISGGRGTASTKTKTVNLTAVNNSIAVTVRSADNTNQISYFLNVTRAPSTDATLSGLALAGSTLSPVFDSGTDSYTAADVATESISITPTTTDPGATVTINGNTATSGSSNAVLLTPGSNTVTIAVLAQDGIATDNYTIAINRLIPAAPTLSYGGPQTVTVNAAITAPILPAASGVAAAAYSAAKTVLSNTIANPTGIATDPSGNLFVANIGDGTVYKFAGGTGSPVAFKSGFGTLFNIAADAAGNVFVADGSDPAIEEIPAAGGSLIQFAIGQYGNTGVTVDAANNLYVTNANGTPSLYKIAAGGSAVTLSSSLAIPYAVSTDSKSNLYVADPGLGSILKLNAGGASLGAVGSGVNYATDLVTDAQGNVYVANNDAVKMISADGSTTTTLTSGFSSLFGIALGSSGVIYVTDNGNGTVNKLNPVGGFYITPSLPAGLVFNSATGAISGTATVTSPATNYTITAYNSGGSTSTVLNLKVAAPSADLSALAISSGSLSPVFAAATITYTTTVPNTVTSINLTPTAATSSSMITVNNVAVTSGSASADIPLTVGANTIKTVVTSGDGLMVKTYTLVVTRAAALSNNIRLSMDLSTGSAVTYTSSVGIVNYYTASVSPGTPSLSIKPVAADPNAIITVNGRQVASGASSQLITLNSDTTTAVVVITAADGITKRTEKVKITQNGPTATSLSISLSTGSTITFGSSKGTVNYYTASVTHGTASLTLKPTATDPNAAITVDGKPVISGANSQLITLNSDTTTIIVGFTATDGVTKRTYRVTVSQLGSSNASMSFTLSTGSTISYTGSSGVFNYYSASVSNGTASLTLKPTAADPNATVTVNGQTVQSGANSQLISLNSDTTTIIVGITAADGITKRSNRVLISHNGLGDASLTMALSTGSSLNYISSTGIINYYTASVTHGTTSLTLKPTATDPNATLTVNGQAVLSGANSQLINLNSDTTTIFVGITAADGITQRLERLLVSQNGSSNISLNMTLSTGSTVSFISNSGIFNYCLASVTHGTSSLTLKPIAGDPNATITVDGIPVISGNNSQLISLNSDTTTIFVGITATDGTTKRIERVLVSQNGSSNVSLSMALSTGSTLSYTGSSGTSNYYTASVTQGTSSLTLKPTAGDPNAIITVDGIPVISGANSQLISLNSDTTTIFVGITAADGTTQRIERVLISQNGSSNISLSMALSTGSTLSYISNSGIFNYYTASVTHGTSSLTLKPTAADPNASITVDGIPVNSGANSQLINLNSDTTTIFVGITAADGITQRIERVLVSQNGSSNISLSMALSTGSTLSYISNSGIFNYYTASVTHGTSSLTLKPTAADPTAAITVNGRPVISGSNSQLINLNSDTTTIFVGITAADGITQRIERVLVSQIGSSNISLSMVLSTGSILSYIGNSGIFNYYTASVTHGTSSLTLKPTAADPAAAITVNGRVVISGTNSQLISLNSDTTTIFVGITAADGITQRIERVLVSQGATASTSSNTYSIALLTDQQHTAGELKVHGAVSPNGDGINDYLLIEGIAEYPDNKLTIMNRNGDLVYEVNGYDNAAKAFDGHSNKTGSMQLPGTYFYSLQYKVNGDTKFKTGFIVLKY